MSLISILETEAGKLEGEAKAVVEGLLGEAQKTKADLVAQLDNATTHLKAGNSVDPSELETLWQKVKAFL